MSFISITVVQVKPRANGRNIVVCDMLHPFCIPCCMLLGVFAQSLKPVKLLATSKQTQQLPTVLRNVSPLWLLQGSGHVTRLRVATPST